MSDHAHKPADQRAAFEAWALDNCDYELSREEGSGEYHWHPVQRMWAAWQAALAARGNQAAEPPASTDPT